MQKKISCSLAILAIIMLLSPLRLSYGDTYITHRSVEGAITDINEDRKQVSIRWLSDPVNLIYKDMVVQVPTTATIMKNSQPIEFNDLESGDHATIRYNPDADPLPEAASILVVE